MSAESTPIDINDFETAVEELPDDTLVSLKSQLHTSLEKLKSTNEQLEVEIDNTKSEEDIKLYKGVIVENVQVIRNQEQRSVIVDQELVRRGKGEVKDGVYL